MCTILESIPPGGTDNANYLHPVEPLARAQNQHNEPGRVIMVLIARAL